MVVVAARSPQIEPGDRNRFRKRNRVGGVKDSPAGRRCPVPLISAIPPAFCNFRESPTRVVHTMRVLLLLICASALVLAYPSQSRAQADSANDLIQTPSGPIEFVGLRSWEPRKLWDSIYALAPGNGAHACAATLTSHFRFAGASVVAYPESSGGFSWVVMVVEAGDTAKLDRLPLPSTRFPAAAGVRSVYSFLHNHPFVEQIGIGAWPKLERYGRDSAMADVSAFDAQLAEVGHEDKAVGGAADSIWSFLRLHGAPDDLERALRTLREDATDTNRYFAVLTLLRFPQDDRAWYALIDEERSSARSATIARSVLDVFQRRYARRIDWAPAVAGLRSLLAGTNLFAFDKTLRMLVSTRVDTAVAFRILRQNTHLIDCCLRARHEATRDVAAEFVAFVSGRPTLDIASLRKWLAAFD